MDAITVFKRIADSDYGYVEMTCVIAENNGVTGYARMFAIDAESFDVCGGAWVLSADPEYCLQDENGNELPENVRAVIHDARQEWRRTALGFAAAMIATGDL